MAEYLEFDAVAKSFGAICAVDHVSFSVRKGEFFSILGPSGCGKTTLLRIVAGFEQPDAGRVLLEGQDITPQPPNRRHVNTIFQNYALFPHLSVYENIAFGLRVARRPRAEIDDEVRRMLRLIQMEDKADRRPDQISGGQKQRVAIARALINKPGILLLDEPLGALDLKLRQHMLLELDRIHDEVGITFLYVTHDQTEAMSLSDRIAVMNGGRIEQIGTPAEVYEAPKSSFVAAFIGDTNFFDGAVSGLLPPDYCELRVPGFPPFVCFNDTQKQAGDLVHLSIRPEKFHIAAERPQLKERHNLFEAKVADIIYVGNHTKYWVEAAGHRIAIYRQHARFQLDEKPIRWGDHAWVWWHADDGYMLERYSAQDERI